MTSRSSRIGRANSPESRTGFWVADLTYVAIASGFVYVALIMDAWSHRIVGCPICRRIGVLTR